MMKKHFFIQGKFFYTMVVTYIYAVIIKEITLYLKILIYEESLVL